MPNNMLKLFVKLQTAQKTYFSKNIFIILLSLNLCFGKQCEVRGNTDPKHVVNKHAADREK